MTRKGATPIREVACPTCGTRVAWQPANRFRPFCSERCKISDLGAWANEEYKVPIAPEEPGEEIEDDGRDV